MTEFRRRARFHQAQWREAMGYPIGSQPLRPRPAEVVRPVGSRMPLGFAKETGANFLTDAALTAATHRTSYIEREQSIDLQGLWADLLAPTALAFNLFGDLAADPVSADRAVHDWWPDVPGVVSDVCFEHSPGRLDPAFIANLCAFSTMFTLDIGDSKGVAALSTAYHGYNRPQPPKPARLARYLHVTEASGMFVPGFRSAVDGTDLIHIWLDHALMLSMLQHISGTWSWGRFVVVYPADNCNFADACARYRELLHDDSTFATMTVEEILDSGSLPATTTAAIRQRYVPAGG